MFLLSEWKSASLPALKLGCERGVDRVSRLALHLRPPTLLVKMSGFDADRVFSVSVHDVPEPTGPDSPSQTEKLLLEFLLQYRVGGDFIYRCAAIRLCGMQVC